MIQYRENCIFCKLPKQLTRQHVYPDWLKRIFPHPKKTNTSFSQMNISRQGSDGVVVSPRIKGRSGYVLTLNYRKVCKDCNSGWISRLENSLIPQIENLILGQDANIGTEALNSLATWVSIVTIMAEYSYPEMMGIPDSAANYIFETRSPLPFSKIYIGQYLGQEYSPLRYRHIAGTLVNRSAYHAGTATETKPNYQTSIHVLGELIILVDSTTEELAQLIPSPPLNSGLIPIHPAVPDKIDWPPRGAIGDKVLDEIFNGRMTNFM